MSGYTCLERRQAGQVPKAHPSQAGTWLPASPGQRQKSGPGKPHLLSHDTTPCRLETGFKAVSSPPTGRAQTSRLSPGGPSWPSRGPSSEPTPDPARAPFPHQNCHVPQPMKHPHLHSRAPANFQTIRILFILLLCIAPLIYRTQWAVRG